ncbi:MAG TPA: lysine--tRNA ligase [Gammaproteobacteria bacterium]|nr:lysine--tRNA ligase [Gammaproteobacteria bacterium]
MAEQEEHELIALRREKLKVLREKGIAFPNDFRRDHLAAEIFQQYGEGDTEQLDQQAVSVMVAGRIMTRRVMGKAAFIHIKDVSGQIQVYLRKNDLSEGVFEEFKKWDLGDIVGVSGILFRTKTGELSVRADTLRLLTKSIRPLPEKFHGLQDAELRARQRYVDLIMNDETRERFRTRSRIVAKIRQFLEERDYLEVETPMMQILPGGAYAKPFATHHNALDMALYLRVAPELFLKRCVVGGFEKVFEINRNFRNEGLSTRHNPEFTMLEFYCSYEDYHYLMDLTEALMREIAEQVIGRASITYQGETIDFAKPFTRMTLVEAILAHNTDLTEAELHDLSRLRALANEHKILVKESYGMGKLQLELFEKTAEHKLIDPTFITQYPVEVSPLARPNDENPFVTDRFELFIGGREIANGFSELNDAEDQAERFIQQAKERAEGDEEAMQYDEDYIHALEYGMPPTAGEGIGIDRLVMLFTDSPSIRDVLLFPYMRPNKKKSVLDTEDYSLDGIDADGG